MLMISLQPAWPNPVFYRKCFNNLDKTIINHFLFVYNSHDKIWRNVAILQLMEETLPPVLLPGGGGGGEQALPKVHH